MVVAAYIRGGVSFPRQNGHIMVLPLPRESCWLLEKRYLYTDISPRYSAKKNSLRALPCPCFSHVMKNLEISEGRWITGVNAVHSEGHRVMVSQMSTPAGSDSPWAVHCASQPASGSEILIAKVSKARAVARTALQNGRGRFHFKQARPMLCICWFEELRRKQDPRQQINFRYLKNGNEHTSSSFS